MKFDENLASIHAYLCADGYLTNPEKWKNYTIGFRNTNIILLEDFKDKFTKYFGIEPKLIEGERCYKDSKTIHQKLIKYFGLFRSRRWKAPQINKRLICVWLKSFFDCEGWVYCKSHQNRHIGLDSVNEKGLNQVIEFLNKVGIKTIKKVNQKRKIYRIFIYGKENLIKFREKINFLNPDKKKKLKLAIDSYINYSWDFPKEKRKLKEFIKDIIRSKGKFRKDRQIIRIISNKEKNLSKLSEGLKKFFGIKSKIYKMKNGFGTVYYELNINDKADIQSLINLNIL